MILTHGLIRCDFIFVPACGLVIRRNLLFMLIGLENHVINAPSALAFVVAAGATGAVTPMVR